MWDQTAALEAHRRLATGRVYLGAVAPDADEEQGVTPQQPRRGMTHMCRDCGVTDQKLFRKDMKSQCNRCKNRQQGLKRSVKALAGALIKRGRTK